MHRQEHGGRSAQVAMKNGKPCIGVHPPSRFAKHNRWNVGLRGSAGPTDAESAAKASVDKFGRIDVLVNNAANFYAGFFEELLPEQMER
jgi:NAD(P)-dependent dehydrogenase (short-subunit alcohol dehydrogenase family)